MRAKLDRLIKKIGARNVALIAGVSASTVRRWRRTRLKSKDRRAEVSEIVAGIDRTYRAGEEEKRATARAARELLRARRNAEKAIRALTHHAEKSGALKPPRPRAGFFSRFSTEGFEALFAVGKLLTNETISRVVGMINSVKETAPRLPFWLVNLSLSVMSLNGHPSKDLRGYVTVMVIPSKDRPRSEKFIAEMIISSGLRYRRSSAIAKIQDDLLATLHERGEIAFVRSALVANYRHLTDEEIKKRQSVKRRQARKS